MGKNKLGHDAFQSQLPARDLSLDLDKLHLEIWRFRRAKRISSKATARIFPMSWKLEDALAQRLPEFLKVATGISCSPHFPHAKLHLCPLLIEEEDVDRLLWETPQSQIQRGSITATEIHLWEVTPSDLSTCAPPKPKNGHP